MQICSLTHLESEQNEGEYFPVSMIYMKFSVCASKYFQYIDFPV